jgi:hypothetical protein
MQMIVELVAISLGGNLFSQSYIGLTRVNVSAASYGGRAPAPEEPKRSEPLRQEGWEGPGRRAPGMPEGAYIFNGGKRKGILGDSNPHYANAVNLPIKQPVGSGMGRKGRF